MDTDYTNYRMIEDFDAFPYAFSDPKRFISGDIPANTFIIRPPDKELPLDENGKKKLDFNDHGRGRLLTELLAINREEVPYTGPDPEENDPRIQSATAFRILSAFLSDISVTFRPDSFFHEVKDIAKTEMFPVVTYKLFSPESVVYCPDRESEIFQEYQAARAIYEDLVAKSETIPDELINELDAMADALFYGEENTRIRAEHMEGIVHFILQSTIVRVALYRIFLTKEELENLFTKTKKSDDKTNRSTLFSNSKELDHSKQFGVPKLLADNLGRGIKTASRAIAIKQYEDSDPNPRNRTAIFKIKNRDSETKFVFDEQKYAIKTAEQFADQLMKLKDAKVLKTFFALMKWANMNDSPYYRDVPISEIMSLILKPSDGNKFNTSQRREYSGILKFLASISITVSVVGQQINIRTKKSKAVLKEEEGVKIFRLESTYSVKKEFQSLPKEQLDEEIHFDKSVITRFSGELLPGKGHLFTQRASIYFDSLLHLDSNKDSTAIVLGFQIQTRFNQLTDKEKFIDLDRGFLIDICDYGKTDKQKAAVATQQLRNTLDKLIKAGIISKYSGLTNSNADKVRIMPPKGIKPKELAEHDEVE